MSWMKRFTLVMCSNISYLRDKVEDPERMLQQLIIDMEEELEAIRKSVAGAIADEILLRKRVAQARTEADQWFERAKQALDRNNESTAKAALEQKGFADERVEQLTQEHTRQKGQTDQLRRSVAELEEKIRQARQKRTLLLARMHRAQSSQTINAALDRASGQTAFAEFSRLETRVEREEAMAEAYEQLDGRDPDADELSRRFAEEERQARLNRELEELKSRVHGPDA